MTLSLSTERRNDYRKNEAESNILVTSLLSKVWEGDLPEIDVATIEGDRVYLTLGLKKSGSAEVFKGRLKPRIPVDLPFKLAYSTDGAGSADLKMQLEPGKSHEFRFEKPRPFHETAYGILSNLEKAGLPVQPEAQVCVAYETPTAFWRGLPSQMLEAITEFQFNGRFYSVEWPKETRFYTERDRLRGDEKEISVSVLDGVEYKDKEREFARLAELLEGAKFVQHSVTKQRSYPTEMHHFKVDPKEMNYSKMQMLEEIARTEPADNIKSKSGGLFGSRALVLVEGKLPIGVLGQVPEAFENYIAYKIGASLSAGNLQLTWYRSNSGAFTHIEQDNATLEDAARLVSVGAGGRMYFSSKDENGCLLKEGYELIPETKKER